MYISDYILDLGRKFNMDCIWGVNNNRFEVEALVGNGKMRKVQVIILFYLYLYYVFFNLYYRLLIFIKLLLIYISFIVVGRVWDTLHLCIVNNPHWMKLWIEECEVQHDGRLSWERVSTLIKKSHRNEDPNLM